MLENSIKTTDYVYVIRQVLLHHNEALKKFMDERIQVFQAIKADEKVPANKLSAFIMFYNIVLQGNYTQCDSDINKILIGIY
jgi:hypothetical protein